MRHAGLDAQACRGADLAHGGYNDAVKGFGRKKLIVAGIATEICVLFPLLQMPDEGYEVQGCLRMRQPRTRSMATIALRRVEQARVIVTHDQLISELAVDWRTPLGQELSGVLPTTQKTPRKPAPREVVPLTARRLEEPARRPP